MAKNLRWKVIVIVTVIAVAVYAFYPPTQKVHLGLDLKGGVHLVLRVQTDDALKLELQTTADRLVEQAKTANIPAAATVNGPTSFTVTGIAPEQDGAFRNLLTEVDTNYDRTSSVGTYTFTLKPNIARQLREDTVTQALQTIERRVNELGVSEPVVARHSAADQILVQLPGVTDVARAKEIIRNTAILELKIVEAGPAGTQEALLQTYGGKVPDDMEVIQGAAAAGDTSFYLVRKVAAVTGQDLRNARSTIDENNRPAVGFSLTNEGARKFGKATGENIGRLLAIVLDHRVTSAARIETKINDEGRITGNFTPQQVADMSLILRTGALPASLTYLQQHVIGPSLGADSIRSGVIASLVGLLLVVGFMLIYYKLSGVNAVVALVFNLVILLGLMAYVGAVMTLPGIAGFVLTMGIGVDSNVLIFERIKEELEAQRGVRASINAGFGRVFWTLVDTHIAALISVAFLFQFGTGPIRGFAVTLFFGLLSNLFTSIFVSKTLFELVLSGRQQPQAATLSI